MKFKKILSGLLAVASVLTSSAVLSVTANPTMIASAEDETTEETYNWNSTVTFTLSDDGTVATLYGEGEISAVSSLSEIQKLLAGVTTVQFAEDSNFTSFAWHSFNLKNLTSITIPDSVENINDGAFPTSLTNNYDENGFAWADNWIVNFKAPNDWKDVAVLVIPDRAVGIANQAFSGVGTNTKIRTNHFTDNVTVEIGKNVQYIGDRAFQFNKVLASVYIPEDSALVKIGWHAFDQTKATTEAEDVAEKSSLFYLGSYIDEDGIGHGCNWAVQFNPDSTETTTDKEAHKSIVIPEYINDKPVMGIADQCFYWEDIEGLSFDVTLPSVLRCLGKEAFYGFGYNTVLKAITIPDDCQITEIRENTFRDCTEITEISIPRYVTSIGAYAFEDCKALESIQFPDGLQTIGECAFAYTALKEITLPESVTEIDARAFSQGGETTAPLTSDFANGITVLNENCTIAEDVHTLDTIYIYGYIGSTADTFSVNAQEKSRVSRARIFIPLNPATKNPYEMGDVNMDGAISVTDVVLLQKYLLKKEQFTRYSYNLAELNQDGNVNVFDLILLKRILLNQ